MYNTSSMMTFKIAPNVNKNYQFKSLDIASLKQSIKINKDPQGIIYCPMSPSFLAFTHFNPLSALNNPCPFLLSIFPFLFKTFRFSLAIYSFITLILPCPAGRALASLWSQFLQTRLTAAAPAGERFIIELGIHRFMVKTQITQQPCSIKVQEIQFIYNQLNITFTEYISFYL